MPLIYAYKKKTEQKIVYFGQTSNLKRRRYQHEITDPYHEKVKEYNFPLSRGIRKYGIEEYECLVLEDNIPESEIDDREKYWINYYDTYEDPLGYNLTPGGKSGSRYYKFEKSIINLAKSLIKEGRPFSEIKEIAGISIEHLSEINTGKRHFDENENYPLNIMTRGRKTTEEEVNNIYSLLKEGQLTIREISKKINVSESVVSSINTGQCFKRENEIYPLRQKVHSKTRHVLKENELMKLINDLMNTIIPFSELSKKYNIGITTVHNINKGKTRKKDNFSYPLRK